MSKNWRESAMLMSFKLLEKVFFFQCHEATYYEN